MENKKGMVWVVTYKHRFFEATLVEVFVFGTRVTLHKYNILEDMGIR